MFSIFRRKRVAQITDPVFGALEFDPAHGIDMWCHLPSDESDHMVLVVAPSTGPAQGQRQFYASLRNRMRSLESECKSFIATQPSPPPNLSDITVYSVEIGPEEELSARQFVIELSDEDADQVHRVEFRNGRPDTYAMDD
jgi:hypothetical protein